MWKRGETMILVTGGAGYIGGHMVLALLDAGEQPVVIDDMSNGVPWAIPAGVPFFQSDISDFDMVARLVREYRIDAIMHFAARLITPQFYNDPLEYYRSNTVKSCALLVAVQELGVKHVVFSSTAAVYGNSPVNPVPETAPLVPISPYGSSKLMTETMLRDLAVAGDLNFAILRYFNVAGADPQGRYGQSSTRTSLLVQIAAQVALGIRPFIEIYGDDYPTVDGTCVRDYIHVTDLIDAHLAALRHLRNGGKNLTVNCGYGRGYSVKEVLDMTQNIAGRDFERRFAPRRRGDVTEVFADSKLISAELGWRPRYDNLATIVEHALKWEMQLQRRRAS
jgi:UDP-glucose 4-epimerase